MHPRQAISISPKVCREMAKGKKYKFNKNIELETGLNKAHHTTLMTRGVVMDWSVREN